MTWTTRPRSEAAGLAVIRAGQGPRVLLLHGVGLRAEAWGAQIDHLAARYGVRAPDMPGHGATAAQSAAMQLSDYTDRVAGLLTEPTIVMGHSMGAMIALDLAARHPQHVRAVVAMNAVFERSPTAAKAVGARAEALDGRSLPDPAPTLARWFGTARTPEYDACRDWLMGVTPLGYQMAYRAFASSAVPSRAALARIACPALFLTGALEPNSTPGMSRAMARLAPMGRAQVIDGAAHMMPMTHAAQVNAALDAFLAALPTSKPAQTGDP